MNPYVRINGGANLPTKIGSILVEMFLEYRDAEFEKTLTEILMAHEGMESRPPAEYRDAEFEMYVSTRSRPRSRAPRRRSRRR